jgi:hypothetical protein
MTSHHHTLLCSKALKIEKLAINVPLIFLHKGLSSKHVMWWFVGGANVEDCKVTSNAQKAFCFVNDTGSTFLRYFVETIPARWAEASQQQTDNLGLRKYKMTYMMVTRSNMCEG